MSRNAFPKIEREYAEGLEKAAIAKQEREYGYSESRCDVCHQPYDSPRNAPTNICAKCFMAQYQQNPEPELEPESSKYEIEPLISKPIRRPIMREYPRTDSISEPTIREANSAFYKLCTDLEHELQDAEAENASLKAKLSAMTLWLEKNQPDVWKRGIWNALLSI